MNRESLGRGLACLLGLSICVVGCGPNAGTDAGGTDAGGTDAGGSDAGGSDAGTDAAMAIPPTVPALRKPMNNRYFGSVHVPGSMRPVFVWEPSTVPGGGTASYELEYSADPTFGAAVTTTVPTALTDHQPAADLAVSVVVPVGSRYYWRVRACVDTNCSDYSPVWWFNLGRSDRDVNGDGYADVVVGAPRYDSPTTDQGRVYVYHGDVAGLVTTPAVTLDGEAFDDRFGTAVAGAGDVNADGFADLLIGAPQHDAGANEAGRAYLHLGSASGVTATPAATITGNAVEGRLGDALNGAGDVNGDGYDDVIIGAPGLWTISPAGDAYIHLGGPTGISNTPDFTLVGASVGDTFGGAVSSAGDVNGDGYADIIVGAPREDAPLNHEGGASVYLGGPGGIDTMPHQTFSGASTSALLGSSVAPAGDLNGDGYGDIAIGGEGDTFISNEVGMVHVYLGGPGGLGGTADTTLVGGSGDRLGASVASAGDVDGDGYDDLLIGEPGGSVNGAVYHHRGGPAGLETTAEDVFFGAAGARLGESVAGAGDVNADGYADIILGAPQDSSGVSNAGAAYVLYGGAGGIVLLAGTVLFGEATDDRFGFAVATLWRTVERWFSFGSRGA